MYLCCRCSNDYLHIMDTQIPSLNIRKYTVKKDITFRENFCEVHYKAKDNFLLGKWLRSGTSIRETPSNREILCGSCSENFWTKLKETEQLAKRLSEDSNESLSGVSNYQVHGWTKPFLRYEWELNGCQNSECWGDKEQFITFDRCYKSSSQTQYRLLQYKIHRFENRDRSYSLIEKIVNSVYFNVQTVDRLRQEGIGLITVSPTKPFFWPGIHKHLEHGQYYYFIEVFHSSPVHPDFKHGRWPTEYWRRNYLFPTMVDIILYKSTPGLPMPETHYEMAKNHKAASMTCLNLYPGEVSFIIDISW